MGAFTMEIEKVNKTLIENQKEVERLQRKLNHAKEEKENKKQYEKDLKIAIEKDLQNYFINYLEREGLEMGFWQLSLKNKRDEIIRTIGKSEIECDYINENYEKVLNKTKKIFENDKIAQNQIISIDFKKWLEEKKLVKTAKLVGYDEKKIYTKQEILQLGENAKILIEKYKQKENIKEIEKKEEKEKKIENNINNFIISILKIFKWFFIIVFGIIYILFKFIASLAEEQGKSKYKK